jgi:hypothetical protein
VGGHRVAGRECLSRVAETPLRLEMGEAAMVWPTLLLLSVASPGANQVSGVFGVRFPECGFRRLQPDREVGPAYWALGENRGGWAAEVRTVSAFLD